MKKIFFPLVLLIVSNLYAERTTDKELIFYFSPEYNRAFNFCWDISAVSSFTFNNRYTVKGGFAPGTLGNVFYLKAFAGGEVKLPFIIPVHIGLNYNYNGLPEYENHIHSLPLLVSLKWNRAGAALGVNFRFTSFSSGPVVFEPVLTASAYVNIINNDTLKMGLKIASFDDFYYGNFGSYFISFYSGVRLNERFSLINEIDLRQSGSIALAANFYGFVYRGGVKLSW